MGRVKEMVMDLEDKVYDEVADFIPECEDISQAMEKAIQLATEYDLLFYIDKEYVEEAVGEMWNEYWYKHV